MSDTDDPRVLFAAERTLMAWNRTSVSMMAFGFVIERFGLFLEIIGHKEIMLFQRHFSFFVGISFILLASFVSFFSIQQYRMTLKTIKPNDIPKGYSLLAGAFVNGILGVLGIVLGVYLSRGII
jgi:putative membrane protein